MGYALFFRLSHTPAEELVRITTTRALAQGWRVVIRGRDISALDRLDEALWRDPADGFLPHGLSGGPHDAAQPVLLTLGSERPNGAHALITLEGAEVSPEEIAELERVWIVFDGNDDLALQVARSQWRALTGAGAEAEFWSEASGQWRKEADNRKS
ncbi:DNA polymerase III subunit chi [Falsigemmobacter faecalis]|uniref:DNA polymerase III subunit chi n=1 Tax=Falsigemmobacter faecalis TaxID=2488730 RepID=A0A3P3DE84_9RHOB|nr:DNA polymerase III subunit chi [Falsigemmobacter faecalis]RRH72609.1 DNA polymerase III subunit chi [Falsigemmobacter faecalis]